MKPTFCTLLLAAVLFACAPLKRTTPSERLTPYLGMIGKLQKSLLDNHFEQIGKPQIEQGIALSVRQIPFDKSKYKAYLAHTTGKGRATSLTYNDSLPVKPKYLCLELADRIALRSQLNSESNIMVRSYLSKEDNFQIVSKIAFVTNAENTDRLLRSQGVFLSESNNGILEITIGENKGGRLYFSELEIFDYQVSGFCWEQDQYGKERIAAISLNGESCPKGTDKNVQKLDQTKSYLKL